MKKIKGTRKIVLIIVLVALVLGYYFYLSNRNTPAGSEETERESAQPGSSDQLSADTARSS